MHKRKFLDSTQFLTLYQSLKLKTDLNKSNCSKQTEYTCAAFCVIVLKRIENIMGIGENAVSPIPQISIKSADLSPKSEDRYNIEYFDKGTNVNACYGRYMIQMWIDMRLQYH